MSLQLYELRYNLGCVLHQQHDLVGAANAYQQALNEVVALADLPPAWRATLHHNLGVVNGEQGQWEAAIAQYRRAITLCPDYALAHSNLAIALLKQGNAAAALNQVQQAFHQCAVTARLHQTCGYILQTLGRLGDAVQHYQQAIALDETFAIAHVELGNLWQQGGQHKRAIASFQRALALNPDLGEAYSGCAVSLLKQGDVASALSYLQSALERDERSLRFVEAYCQRVSSQAQTHQLSRVRKTCRLFLQQLLSGEANGAALSELCQQWADLLANYGGDRQLQQAEQLYYLALHASPQSQDSLTKLTQCLQAQGRDSAAIIIGHLAASLSPSPSRVWLALGRSLEAQAQWEQAIACYQRALNHPMTAAAMARTDQHVATLDGPPSALVPGAIQPESQSAHKAVQNGQIGQRTCEGLNCLPCLQQIAKLYNPLHLGNGIYMLSGDRVCDDAFAEPTVSVHRLPQGRIWVSPRLEQWQGCDEVAVFDGQGQLVASLSRAYPGQLPTCDTPGSPVHSLPQSEQLPPPVVLPGTVAVLAGLSGQVYFHWMVDILPRIALLEQQGIHWSDLDGIVVNSLEHPFQRETLYRLGIPAEKMIESDRTPHITADTLVVPSFPAPLGWLSATSLNFLRAQLLPLNPTSRFSRRLYIRRQSANYRQVLNEDEVIHYLTKHGFSCLDLETLSVADQAIAFAHAEIIIAPHGSGLTNLVFCQPETTVIELFSPHYIRHYFWVISQRLKLKHYFIVGSVFSCYLLRNLMYLNPLMEDIWVDLNALQRALQMVLTTSNDCRCKPAVSLR